MSNADGKQEVWRLTWGLDIFQEPPEGIPVLDAPDVNCFRMKFASQEEAAFFRTEVQRFLGDLLFRLSDNAQLPGVLRDMRALFEPKEQKDDAAGA